VGSINKPKTVFMLGYSQEQVYQKLKQFIRNCKDDKYNKENRRVSFCGIVLRCFMTYVDGHEQYTFVVEDDNVKFVVEENDILVVIEAMDK